MPSSRKLRTGLIFKYLLLAGFLSWLAGYVIFLGDLYRTFPPNLPAKKADMIVVLTGGANRIASGIELLQRDVADRLFISGVGTNSLPHEVVRSTGLSLTRERLDCCVKIGRRASDTHGNAREVKEFIDNTNARPNFPPINRIILVTSDYHMKRAYLEFAHAISGVEMIPYPVKTSQIKDGFDGWSKYLKITFWEYNKGLIIRGLYGAAPPGHESLETGTEIGAEIGIEIDIETESDA